MNNTNFADRLLAAIEKKQNPSCIGLDTDIKFLPKYLKDQFMDKVDYPGQFEREGEALFEFNREIINSTHSLVPAYKLQIAFYEQYKHWGYEAIEKTCDFIKENTDCLAIVDSKRNDILNTAKQYSNEFLGHVQTIDGKSVASFDVDAITVNPYLGWDGIKPFSDDCNAFGKGIFALVKTSNKSSGDFQDIELNPDNQSALVEDNNPLFAVVGRKVAEWGEDLIGERGYSSLGAVVGATYPHQAASLRKIMPRAIILVPGYGVQGGGAAEVLPNFNDDGLGAIVNNSRGIIAAHQKQFKDRYPDKEFYRAAFDAAQDMKEDITLALTEAGKLR